MFAVETEDGRTSGVGHVQQNLTHIAVNGQDLGSSALSNLCNNQSSDQKKKQQVNNLIETLILTVVKALFNVDDDVRLARANVARCN